jgi:predicted mannosyl-3-phosphoglycerate phosphatase (HAD superfamily)
MGRLKKPKHKYVKGFLELARELRLKLHEIDQKLDHLIEGYRKFHFTSDVSHSTNHEFTR